MNKRGALTINVQRAPDCPPHCYTDGNNEAATAEKGQCLMAQKLLGGSGLVQVVDAEADQVCRGWDFASNTCGADDPYALGNVHQ